ncbi:hypothetical protein HPC49_14525 [Pyxidicoccus fallax]|uniref:Uncharacterized protein n=1 Tax=Pyxidicoccus fallax TaxID=394095 RepID=A0A848LMD6_9BACT|nr:hypothetical protein [Pyxidicoccus fallax]NMO18948.1 hypothetical protein [Pyxidicoccus fallax]NPC79447.1 hypothetical protein [Pyxidicoccus fallax]
MARERIDMWLEKSSEVWTAQLRPSGWGRYGNAVFLGGWLCGWAVGEVVALGVLVRSLWARVLPGLQVGLPDIEPASSPLSVWGLLFMGVWLTGWTVGGIFALRRLRALLVSEARLSFNRAGVTREWRLGPWWSRFHLERGALVDVDLGGPRGALFATLTTGKTVDLLRGGTAEQRRELLDALRERLSLAWDESSQVRHTPPGWDGEPLPAGGWVLRSPHEARQRQGRVWSVAALGLAACAVLLTWRLLLNGGLRAGVLFAAVIAVLAALAAVMARRGFQGPESWEVRRGALVHARHGLFRTRRTEYASPELNVERTLDEDGDIRFDLWVRAKRMHWQLASSFNTPRGLLHLGNWLAHRLGSPLILSPPDLGNTEPVPRRDG